MRKKKKRQIGISWIAKKAMQMVPLGEVMWKEKELMNLKLKILRPMK